MKKNKQEKAVYEPPRVLNLDEGFFTYGQGGGCPAGPSASGACQPAGSMAGGNCRVGAGAPQSACQPQGSDAAGARCGTGINAGSQCNVGSNPFLPG